MGCSFRRPRRAGRSKRPFGVLIGLDTVSDTAESGRPFSVPSPALAGGGGQHQDGPVDLDSASPNGGMAMNQGGRDDAEAESADPAARSRAVGAPGSIVRMGAISVSPKSRSIGAPAGYHQPGVHETRGGTASASYALYVHRSGSAKAGSVSFIPGESGDPFGGTGAGGPLRE